MGSQKEDTAFEPQKCYDYHLYCDVNLDLPIAS